MATFACQTADDAAQQGRCPEGHIEVPAQTFVLFDAAFPDPGAAAALFTIGFLGAWPALAIAHVIERILGLVERSLD